MKIYGETTFDICYLLIAIITGIIIYAKSKNKLGKMMGASTLILGIGDSFHLLPRMLDYFVDADFTAAIRKMSIIRNIPFVIMGLMIIALYFNKRKEDAVFKNIWLYVLLSFLFYIPVVVGASSIKMLGMLMLPKTVCYILMILVFKRKIKEGIV